MYFNEPYSTNKKYFKEISQKINQFIFREKNYILSKNVSKFELNLSKYLSVKYAVAVKNGTDALYIALKSIGIQNGDEVILPILSATATLSAIIQTGAKPVFCEINHDYFTIEPKSIKENITSKTKAIVAVNLYGQSCDFTEIIKILKLKKIHIVEDCAQSFGSEYNNKKLGNFGVVSAFSFFPTKNLGAIGDGGAVCTNNKKIFSNILKIRQYGWNKKRVSVINGINSRLDEIQAIILNIKLKNFKKNLKKKIEIANYYNKHLRYLPIVLPKILESSFHSFHLYVIKVKKNHRDKIINYLKKNDIHVGIHYRYSLNKMPISKKFLTDIKYHSQKIPDTIISLPIYESMPLSHAKLVVRNMKNFYESL